MIEDEFGEEPFCLYCGSTSLFRDEHSDDLICSDCNTQSQSLSQRETTEEDNSMAVTKIKSGSTRKSNFVVVEEDEIEEDFRVPTLLECTEAFISLVEIAAKRSVSEDLMPQLDHIEGFSNFQERVVEDAREIFLLFLERWDESANYFMTKFPGLRISLKDKFLTDSLRQKMLLQMNQSVNMKIKEDMNKEGSTRTKKKIKSEEDSGDHDADSDDDQVGEDSQSQPGSKPQSQDFDVPPSQSSTRSPKQVRWNDSQDTLLFDSQESCINSPMSTRIGDSPISHNWTEPNRNTNKTSWKSLKSFFKKSWKDFKDDSLYWKLDILDLSPDLNLVTSIVYLAHLRSYTGVASNHFVMWAKMGKYPYLLDAYGHLGETHRKSLQNLKSKWRQDRSKLVSPQKLDQLTIMLLTCLVDPEDEEDNFLSEIYRLNADRLKSKELLEGDYMKILEKERKKMDKLKEIDTNEKADEMQQQDSSQQSPTRSLHLGQYSQDSEEAPSIFNNIPVSFFNVGMMCSMFCAHLGVENRVLNFSYAIMGMPVYYKENDNEEHQHGEEKLNQMDEDKREYWLPAALELARPSRLISPVHAIAVIVVACKFCPGWERWVIRLSEDEREDEAKGNVSSPPDDGDDDDSSSSSDNLLFSNRKKKRKSAGSYKGRRAENITSFGELGLPPIYDSNGGKTLNYLDSIPKSENKAKFTSDDFTASLSVLSNKSSFHRKRKNHVSGNTILSGQMDRSISSENSAPNMMKLSNEHGLCEYLAYNRSAVQNSTGVHGPYFTLLSFIADSLCVNRKALHYLVTRFDEEIIFHAENKRKLLRKNIEDGGNLRKNLLNSSYIEYV